MKKFRFVKTACFALTIYAVVESRGQLVVESQFTSGLSLVGAGFDESFDRIWVYEAFATNLQGFSRTGVSGDSVVRGGEGANDADIDFNREEFMLGATLVPANSMLFVNGENGHAEVYAIDKQSKAVIATLATAFGSDHVVGGAYHAERNTLFLIADKLDSVTPSTIAEINPVTGTVINSFGTGSADYTINYGDIAVAAYTGNLLLVSSDESAIRELTPTGVFVRDIPLPAGVGSISGIGVDDQRNQAILGGTGGTVWIVRGVYSTPVLTIRYVAGAQAEICWNARADRSYTLQRRPTFDAGTAWTDYKTNIVGVEPNTCLTENIAGTSPYYYRVQELARQIP